MEETIKKYIDAFKVRHYNIIRNKDIKTNDPSLLFLNSSMAIFKDDMSKGKYIKKTVCVQDCLRNNNELTSLKYFRMLGIIASSAYLDEAGKILFDFLFNDVGIDKKYLYCVAHKDDLVFRDFWCRYGNKDNFILTDENDEQYSTRWTYGKNFEITGKGLTLVYNNPLIEKCSDKCTIYCGCKKYVQFGNIIIANHNDVGYLDFGLGLERLLSCRYLNDIYKIPEIKEYIRVCVDNKYSLQDSYAIYNLIHSIHKILSSGIRYGNKKEGYVLKSITRQITDIISDYVGSYGEVVICDRIFDLYHRYNVIYHEADDSYVKCVIDEVKKYIKNLNRNLVMAYRVIDEDDSSNIEEKAAILHDRYGLPYKLVEKILFDDH